MADSVEVSLYKHLQTAIPEVNGRIYPLVLPQSATIPRSSAILPAITYAKAAGRFLETLDGGAGSVSRLFQITIWHPSLSQAAAINDRVRHSLQGFRGTLGSPDGVVVTMTSAAGERHVYDPDSGLTGDQ